jgi:heme-degrading monooxygenase HmoA
VIAVLFEARLGDGQQRRYLDLAEALRPQLDQVEGFVSVERFQSLADPDKLLSLSFFRDEAALDRWRNLAAHRAAQARGREGIFASYRIRIAAVMRDYGMHERAAAPADSLTAHGAPGR